MGSVALLRSENNWWKYFVHARQPIRLLRIRGFWYEKISTDWSKPSTLIEIKRFKRLVLALIHYLFSWQIRYPYLIKFLHCIPGIDLNNFAQSNSCILSRPQKIVAPFKIKQIFNAFLLFSCWNFKLPQKLDAHKRLG